MKGKFHMIKKSLLILLTAASIALSGCGQNSAAGTAPAESSTKAESTAASEPNAPVEDSVISGAGASVSYLGPGG